MTDGVKPQGLFEPDNLEWPSLKLPLLKWKLPRFGPEGCPQALPVGPDGLLCLGCGMVWGKADPEKAKQQVERFGTDELKSILKNATDCKG